jgi:hypothetical protein
LLHWRDAIWAWKEEPEKIVHVIDH